MSGISLGGALLDPWRRAGGTRTCRPQGGAAPAGQWPWGPGPSGEPPRGSLPGRGLQLQIGQAVTAALRMCMRRRSFTL